ncbi:MAG TPA: oxidoreductase, partial [Candidatus Binatia bacterium]|nr:oxidoreductase [Candidatus Binatia bacterium]
MSTAADARIGAPVSGRPGARWPAALAGAVAVSAALGVGELLAGLQQGVPSPLASVARFFVDVQPPGAKDLVVALFGENDKLAFEIFIVLVALGIGALVGRLAVTRFALAAAVIAAFAAAGFLAGLREPNVSPVLAGAVAGVQVAVGVWVLRRLLALAPAAPSSEPATAPDAARPGMPDWGRRSLLQAGGAIAVGSL